MPPLSVAVTLTLLLAPAAADVLVVDPAGGPGADFTVVQQAADAASDGDTLLLRPGTYQAAVTPSLRVVGKSLTVVADGPSVRFVRGIAGSLFPTANVAVEGLPAGGRVVLRGFASDFGVRIAGCAGSVWLDGLSIEGGSTGCSHGAVPGLEVVDGAAVTLTRCEIVGETGGPGTFFLSPDGSDGLSATSSSLRAFDCLFAGGDGELDSLAGSLGAAGAGASLRDSTLLLVGCAIEGGESALPYGPTMCSVVPLAGGPGLELRDAASVVQAVESTAVGGKTDLDPLCPGLSGPAGPAILGPGTVVPLYGYARHLRADTPTRGGETLTLEVGGRPGELPLLLVSDAPFALTLPQHSGALLVTLPPVETYPLAALPASGQATLGLAVPSVGLPPGAVTLYAQPVFFDTSGPAIAVWLGAGTTLVLLDPSL